MILNFSIRSGRTKKVLGYTGSAFWLLIIPSKLNRYFGLNIFEALNDNLPSFLGAAGLFLILLSTRGKLSNLTVVHSALLAISVSVIVEAIQLIPRPGILAYVHYTFDYLDILFSIIGVAVSYFTTVLLYSKNILKN